MSGISAAHMDVCAWTALTVLGVLGAVYVVPVAIKAGAVRLLWLRCVRRRVVVLSFDDGPSAESTRQILARLQRLSVQASFFPVGCKLSQLSGNDPYRSGKHSLGSHSFEHVHAWKSLPWVSLDDARRGITAVKRLRNEVRFFRPPYGKINLFTYLWLWLNDYSAAWWTVDSGDTWETLPTPDLIVTRVIQQGGGVVLMHDGENSNPARLEYKLALVLQLVTAARAAGLSVATFDQLYGSTV